ncbi:PH domain-containing protein [Actinomadura craniellae]|uniref:PH domain-containing protein n=1 Tax=Actinomadura craniellae TaxID=2231787 RepID=A0A365HET3_9ACTN|nr:PH domain-containing protein [Actinomadura craniellae]RAY16703.1 PH domain-containing protein [Actinomadura craniellae]
MAEIAWRVPGRHAALKGAAALALAVLAALSLGDPRGVLLAGAGAVAAGVLALRDVLAPVRLAADGTGVTVVRGFAGRRHVPWADVVAVRVDERRHHGVRSRLLEIDVGDDVHLFSGHDLGADPEDARRALAALRTGHAPSPG